MADLSTSYMGIPLKNPLILGASNLVLKPDIIHQLEEAGILAIDCGSAGLPGPQQQSCKVMAAGRFPDKLIVPFNGQNLASIKSWLAMVSGNIGIDLTARKIALNDRLKSEPGQQPGK